MKYACIIAGALCLISSASIAVPSQGECHASMLSVEDQETKEVSALRVAIVDEAPEMIRGLMHVESMPEDAGMLFVYPKVSRVSFWMKNTLIPLDMIFIKDDGSIAHIHHNAVPHDLTPISSEHPVQYVLEVNGGVSEDLGFSVGDTVLSAVVGTGCVDHTGNVISRG